MSTFPALALLSNYIQTMEDDAEDVEYWDEDDNTEDDCTETVGRTEDEGHAIAMHDAITQHIWLDYQDYQDCILKYSQAF